jgi:hypothetical protein
MCSKSIQDDLAKKKRNDVSLPSACKVITQEHQDERTRYHIPMLDGGDDRLKAEDSMIRDEETRHKTTQGIPMSPQTYPS